MAYKLLLFRYTLNAQSHTKPEMSYSNFVDSPLLHLLTSSLLHLAVLLQTDSRHGDESGGLSGRKVTNLIHAGLGHVIQLLGLGETAKDGHAALVRSATDLTVDGLLGGSDGGLEELALGREVETVVKDLWSY